MTDWMSLKSGSDIRGTAVETDGAKVNLTDEAVSGITVGFYAWLRKSVFKPALKIAVGHDSRISSDRIKEQVISTLKGIGVDVVDCGLCSTPAMFMITVDETEPCDASIQITASHHPYDKNGLKFFTPDGGLESGDISEILQYASEGTTFAPREGRVVKRNYIDVYAGRLVEFVRGKTGQKTPLRGMRIVVDAGNGVGGFYCDKVLKPLGANTEGSRFLQPDGYFPNHVPNPENEQAMLSICEAVRDSRADFGIIFDTDVDRAGAVSPSGTEINRNRLIALMSAILLEEQSPAVIVTDSVTSDGLKKFIESRGGTHRRFKRGYKNVINECKRLNDEGIYSPLAIETSGHAALKENRYLDDGAYLVTRILIKLAALRQEGKNIDCLTEDLEVPAEEAEVRLGFNVAEFREYGRRVVDGLLELSRRSDGMHPAEDSYEGVRINFEEGDGFALVRQSVHDPIMPVNIESRSAGGVRLIARQLMRLFEPYPGIDTDKLAALCQE